MTKVAILQSNYIPWKGYFDMINSVDEFVLYDIVQFTKNDWRNRNKIKTPKGVDWLTIPVRHEHLNQKICETKVATNEWGKKHWKTILQNYVKAPFFSQFKKIFEELYLGCKDEYLSQINYRFITAICNILGIKTKIRWAGEFCLIEGQSERLLGLCKDLNAHIYLSGPAAKNYLDVSLFQQEKIAIEWMDYSDYPMYSQLYPPFDHSVSILDLIFNEGNCATRFMKSFKK